MAKLQEVIDNANAIMTGEKKIEVDTGFTATGMIALAVTLVITFVIIFGIARIIKPFKTN